MKVPMYLALTAVFIALAVPPVQADVFRFDLFGVGGDGLLTSNELHATIGGGSGGEVGPGITYDDVTMELTVNIGWGSGNGFTDLSGDATAAHIHGPADISSTAGVQEFLSGVPGFDADASSGGFSGAIALSAAQETMLFDGDLYINVHTAANGPGEIRGNLFVIPEPNSVVLVCGLLVAGGYFSRRRKN